jgi:hypothetical protein
MFVLVHPLKNEHRCSCQVWASLERLVRVYHFPKIHRGLRMTKLRGGKKRFEFRSNNYSCRDTTVQEWCTAASLGMRPQWEWEFQAREVGSADLVFSMWRLGGEHLFESLEVGAFAHHDEEVSGGDLEFGWWVEGGFAAFFPDREHDDAGVSQLKELTEGLAV